MSEQAGPAGPPGPKGDKGDPGESKLIGTAETMVSSLVRADKHRKWQVCVLGIICGVVLILIGLGAYNSHRISDDATTLRQQSIANCLNNDDFRASQIRIWEKNYALQAQEGKATGKLLTELIATLANHDPARIRQINTILAQSDKASARETQEFLDYIRAADAPKNCLKLYGN